MTDQEQGIFMLMPFQRTIMETYTEVSACKKEISIYIAFILIFQPIALKTMFRILIFQGRRTLVESRIVNQSRITLRRKKY